MDKQSELDKEVETWLKKDIVKGSKPTLYTIKPLEWKKNKETKTWEAKAFHSYYDTYWEGGHCYWFDMDDYRYPCTSIEHGKELVEKHYKEQLGKCLEVYNG